MLSSNMYAGTSERWYKQKNKGDNAEAVLVNLLRCMNIPVTKLTAKETLLSHPGHPSIASLKDTLIQWNIHCMPVFLEINHLDEINYPAIAHTGIAGGHFVLLIKKDNDTVHFIDPVSGWHHLPSNEFSKIWSGATLLVEASKDSGEKNFRKSRTREWLNNARVPFIVTISCLLFFTLLSLGAINHFANNAWLPLIFLKIIGGILSIVLITNELHEGNTLINKLCNIHKSVNCRRVLQSTASTLFGWINISELGAFYFIGGVFTLALAAWSSNPASVISVLAILNLIALPYTVFLIFYQGLVVKKWCPLCLGVQMVLWAESMVMYSHVSLSWHINIPILSLILWGYFLPLLVWLIFRQAYIKSYQLDDLKRVLNRFRGDKNIFSILLEQQNKIEVGRLKSEIIIGNPKAENTVVIVTNPDCNPCATAHREITHLFSNISNKVNIVYRFTKDTAIVRHIINSSLTEGNQKASDILSQWFDLKDENKIMKNADFNVNNSKIREIVDEHLAWCDDARISKTPTILFNGREIPDCYKIADLRYLIA